MKTNQKLAYAITAVLSGYAGPAMAAAAETASSGGLEEVIVTAQRRSESLQNVPITIQAITGDTLGQLNVTTIDDVIKMLPNVTLGNNGPGQGTVFMRGLSAGYAGSQSAATINPLPNVTIGGQQATVTYAGPVVGSLLGILPVSYTHLTLPTIYSV